MSCVRQKNCHCLYARFGSLRSPHSSGKIHFVRMPIASSICRCAAIVCRATSESTTSGWALSFLPVVCSLNLLIQGQFQLGLQDLHDGAQQFLRRGRCVVLCAGRQRPAEHPQQRRCEEQLHDLRDVGDVQAVLRGVGPLPADSLILDKKNGGVALWQATPVRFTFISH